jgi:hypothetical protein
MDVMNQVLQRPLKCLVCWAAENSRFLVETLVSMLDSPLWELGFASIP